VTGRNYRFGRGGAGDTNLLRHYAAEHGLSCLVCPPVEVGGVLVSSTNIRGLVAEGRLEEAAACLGRSYSCYGQVVEGRKWARTIGFPTANYALDNEVLPPPGVWTFSTEWDGGTAYGIGNLGTRPTFGGGGSPVLEIHWLDREADLYGRWMEIVFGRRLRTEMTFGSPDELSAQISRDVARARQWAAGCATAGASR
jgi:riboflavin kinase/FMN adenylyltransferase